MIIETKEVYKCEYCRKLYQIKRFAIHHEILCSKNPANYRPCYGCPILEKKTTTIYHDHPLGGESEQEVSLLYCGYKKTFLYTHKNELKENQFDLGNDSNEPMPKECDVDLNKEGYSTMWMKI